jgi:hypothetical protein
MVLHVDRHPALSWIEGGAARDGPAGQDPVDLQSEVVVEAAGAVALDDESAAPSRQRVPAARIDARSR